MFCFDTEIGAKIVFSTPGSAKLIAFSILVGRSKHQVNNVFLLLYDTLNRLLFRDGQISNVRKFAAFFLRRCAAYGSQAKVDDLETRF